MSTFLQLQNKVLNFFGASDQEMRDEVKEAINDVIAEINDENPHAQHTEETASITLTTGQSNITNGVPSDFGHIINLNLTVAGKEALPLEFMSWIEWNRLRPFDADNGEPIVYTRWKNVLYVGPKPDSNYAGTIDYYKIDSSLTNDTDTGLITDNYARWERLIIMGAKVKIHEYLQTDAQLIVKSDRDYQLAKKRFSAWIRRNFNRSQDASRIRNWKEIKTLTNPLIPIQLRR